MGVKQKSVFKTYLIYFIAMFFFALVRLAVGYGVFDFLDDNSYSIVVTLIIQVGIIFFIPLTLYCMFLRLSPKQVFESFHFYKTPISVILISVLLGLVCFVINIIVSSVFNGLLGFLGYQSYTSSSADYSILSFVINILLIAVLPAFCEEFLHRGMLIQGTKHIGFKNAILISALLFGLLHFNITQFGYAFVVGLIMGFVSVVAKNIWPAIIIHFTNNFLSVYLDFANANKWFLSGFYNFIDGIFNSTSFIGIFFIIIVASCILLAILFWCVNMLYKYAILKKIDKVVGLANDTDKTNKELQIERNEAIRQMIQSNTVINLEVTPSLNPIDSVLPRQKNLYIKTLKDKIFLIGAFVLGIIVTIFTFIWGLF